MMVAYYGPLVVLRGEVEGYLATGNVGERGVGSDCVCVWVGGAGGDGGHGVFVVVGGVASGVSGAAARGSVRWRWPAGSR